MYLTRERADRMEKQVLNVMYNYENTAEEMQLGWMTLRMLAMFDFKREERLLRAVPVIQLGPFSCVIPAIATHADAAAATAAALQLLLLSRRSSTFSLHLQPTNSRIRQQGP